MIDSYGRPPHSQPNSPAKNRMREICTSGTVRGEGGNILTYSAMAVASSARQKFLRKRTETPHRSERGKSAIPAVSSCNEKSLSCDENLLRTRNANHKLR